jgi:hypothetical protein
MIASIFSAERGWSVNLDSPPADFAARCNSRRRTQRSKVIGHGQLRFAEAEKAIEFRLSPVQRGAEIACFAACLNVHF